MADVTVTLGAISERPGFGAGNTLINFIDVPFRINETGDAGMVSIPANQFKADLAHAEVMRKVEEIMKLRNTIGG